MQKNKKKKEFNIISLLKLFTWYDANNNNNNNYIKIRWGKEKNDRRREEESEYFELNFRERDKAT